MKKARVLSTICISLLAAPALAQVPPAGACFARNYDAAHLAANPGQGVAGLRIAFHAPRDGSGDAGTAVLSVRMANQGQALADGAGGLTLRQVAGCRADGASAACLVECDGGEIAVQVAADGGLRLTTSHFAVGATLGCGEGEVISNLAEGAAAPTVYRLAAAPASHCADLLPE